MVARAEAAEATRARILEAARRLFGELPYDQVALGGVAQQAGVTVQTVIRHFGSKERLFAAVAVWRATRIRGERDAAQGGDVVGAIRTLVDSYERWGDEVLHLLAQEQRSPAIGEVIGSGRRYHHAWVRHLFTPPLRDLPAFQLERRMAQLIAVTDVYAWKVLRRDLGLSQDEAEASMRDLVDRILEAGDPA